MKEQREEFCGLDENPFEIFPLPDNPVTLTKEDSAMLSFDQFHKVILSNSSTKKMFKLFLGLVTQTLAI